MTVDNGLRPLFHDNLRKGMHWQAVETGGTGLGIPDSNCCALVGGEFWVEFKATDAWSVGLSAEQVGWTRTRIARGGRVFVAVRRQHSGGPRKGNPVDELWLADGRWAGLLKEQGLKCPDISFRGVWSGGPARWRWDEVRGILEGTS